MLFLDVTLDSSNLHTITGSKKETWLEPMDKFSDTQRQPFKDFADVVCAIPAENTSTGVPAPVLPTQSPDNLRLSCPDLDSSSSVKGRTSLDQLRRHGSSSLLARTEIASVPINFNDSELCEYSHLALNPTARFHIGRRL
ncbi:hypothetical protein B0H65DRAFT_587344 [Neurospora tetraspora]|uniref:Uncharacterized protein n=1 Tax=Neurospora tetraspora TaxID=94610 RepID=A0AAE0JHK7_9PEZI|nr:hypothetical protein B0H65DRAFT_587344 [Neurospora tetraspora]